MSRHSSSEDKLGLELQSHANSNSRKSETTTTTTVDDAYLLRLGKKPVLKRSFGFISILGFSCTVLITWEGALALTSDALLNGGTAGVLWGFLICWLGAFSTFLTIAELASMAPVSGGQYHWVSLLAPASSRKFLSYLTGWVTVFGWQALTVTEIFLCAATIQGSAALVFDYVPTAWQSVLIFWAIVAFDVTVNVISSRALARFESVILFLHLLGFFAVLIPIVYISPTKDLSVFTSFFNGGGWSSSGLSFIVGIPSLAVSLFGADCAVHMSEEIQNPSVVVPRAIVLTMWINGTLGFAILVAFTICMGPLSAALKAVDTLGFAYLEVFQQAVQSAKGAAAMSALLITIAVFASVGTLATTTRLLWAFARDRGVPFSYIISKIHPYSTLPINAILISVVISMLLSLIALGSSVALDDVLSLTIAGLYGSYFICCMLLLYRRLQGKISKYTDDTTIIGPDNLQWGRWYIPEPLGTVNNIFACVYLIWILFWSFWPPFATVTPSNMNFSVVVFGATVIFSVLWYFLRARKYFNGPIVEIQNLD